MMGRWWSGSKHAWSNATGTVLLTISSLFGLGTPDPRALCEGWVRVRARVKVRIRVRVRVKVRNCNRLGLGQLRGWGWWQG